MLVEPYSAVEFWPRATPRLSGLLHFGGFFDSDSRTTIVIWVHFVRETGLPGLLVLPVLVVRYSQSRTQHKLRGQLHTSDQVRELCIDLTQCDHASEVCTPISLNRDTMHRR